MKIKSIILGASIGVGAIAISPFTGGGSILAGVSLISSLSGISTGIIAAGSAALGAGIANSMSSTSSDNLAKNLEREANQVEKETELYKESVKTYEVNKELYNELYANNIFFNELYEELQLKIKEINLLDIPMEDKLKAIQKAGNQILPKSSQKYLPEGFKSKWDLAINIPF
ncbi:MAG: hypothetical protein R3Y52_04315 [Psittacicella sp.]